MSEQHAQWRSNEVTLWRLKRDGRGVGGGGKGVSRARRSCIAKGKANFPTRLLPSAFADDHHISARRATLTLRD